MSHICEHFCQFPHGTRISVAAGNLLTIQNRAKAQTDKRLLLPHCWGSMQHIYSHAKVMNNFYIDHLLQFHITEPSVP